MRAADAKRKAIFHMDGCERGEARPAASSRLRREEEKKTSEAVDEEENVECVLHPGEKGERG